MICKYFSHTVGCIFTLLTMSFKCTEIFNFEVQFIYFCFRCLCFTCVCEAVSFVITEPLFKMFSITFQRTSLHFSLSCLTHRFMLSVVIIPATNTTLPHIMTVGYTYSPCRYAFIICRASILHHKVSCKRLVCNSAQPLCVSGHTPRRNSKATRNYFISFSPFVSLLRLTSKMSTQ